MAINKKILLFSWVLSTLVTILAIFAWLQMIGWQLKLINTLTLFPVLGLIAFSIMWSHYIVSAFRQFTGVDKASLRQYFEITSWVVLVMIFLHPTLLFYGLFAQGFGLPPASYINHYIAPGVAWATFLGTISFFIFLSYELRRRYESASWWKYIAFASDAAMITIFIHAVKLGGLVQNGWFSFLWYFYGLTLAVSLLYTYYRRYQSSKI